MCVSIWTHGERGDDVGRSRPSSSAVATTTHSTCIAVGLLRFFDFDRAQLSSSDQSTLDAKIPIFRASPALRIRIAGNCDERGSDEYNLALGQRRAVAAKRYLAYHGIDASRIETVSYGKERPIAAGHDEAARGPRTATTNS